MGLCHETLMSRLCNPELIQSQDVAGIASVQLV